MPENRELQQHIQKIGDLVRKIESITDSNVRTSATELMRLLMEFHGAAVDRALEIVASKGESGLRLIEDLGRDPLVSSLLVLYGLHPEDANTRVRGALERLSPAVQRGGGDLEIVEISDTSVRLRLSVNGHACGSTANTLKSLVEDAVYDAAPEIDAVVIEGLEEKPNEGFVSIEQLLTGMSSSSVADSAHKQQAVSFL